MNPTLSTGSRPQPAGDDREAPSSVVNAFQPLINWHRVLGFIFLVAAGALPWMMHEQYLTATTMLELTRTAGPWPPASFEWFGLGCGLVAILNAVAFFRSSSGLARFAGTRKVTDLHPALRRLRTVWLILGLSAVLTGGTLAAARWLMEKAQPAAQQ